MPQPPRKQRPTTPADTTQADQPYVVSDDTETPYVVSDDVAPAAAATPPATPTPAPRRGIADAIGDAIDWWKQRPTHTVGSGLAGGAALPDSNVYARHAEPRSIEMPASSGEPVAPPPSLVQRPDVTAAKGVARTRGPSPTRPTQTVAEDENRRLQQTQTQRGTEAGNFTPEKWATIAARGRELAERTRASGDTARADDIERKARNAQLLSENANDADSYSAIALSNLLGIVSDPYAKQRANIAAATQPGATFTPEETGAMTGERVAPARPFSVGKDVVAPLAGQLPVFMAAGAAGRLGAGALGEFASARGATSIGEALGKVANAGAEAEVAGPSIPVRSVPLAKQRIAEEVAQFRAAVPHMVARGATEGQAVGAVMAYRQAREQGATPEQAIGAAAEGVPMNILMGVAGELGLAGLGRAAGIGFDPVGRVVGDVLHGRGLEAPRDLETATREVTGQREEMGQQRATVAQQLDALLNDKIRTSSEAGPTQLGPDEPVPPLVEPAGYRTRQSEDTPLRSAREAGLDRADQLAPTERVVDQFDAVKRMEREREALRTRVETEANDPNLRLERAAQERPEEVQGPRTLHETLADVGPAAERGEPLAQEYTAAINGYADALATVHDAGEKGPSTKAQVALARARAALDTARTKYGRQLGASAVLALAANNDDLTDEEKGAVGLASVGLVLGPKHLGLPHDRAIEIRDAVAPHASDDSHGMGVQRWMSFIRPLFPDDGSAAGPLGQIEGALYRAAEGTNGTLMPKEVHAILTPGETPVEADPLYSRLRRAVTFIKPGEPGYDKQPFPKKWDQPQPAADWIGKLKGSNALSKKELEMLLPVLEHAQQNKVKLDRETMLALVEDAAPRIEHVLLSEAGGKKPDGTAVGGEGDANDILDIGELLSDHAHDRDVLEQQIADRHDRIAAIDSEIEDRQESLADEMANAESHENRRLRELYSTLENAGLSRDIAEDAIDFINEHTYGDEMADVDRAMEKIQDDLTVDEDYQKLLDSNDYTVGEEQAWTARIHTPQWGDGRTRKVTVHGETEEAARAALLDRNGQYQVKPEDIAGLDQGDIEYVVRDKKGRLITNSDDEYEAIREAAQSEGLGIDHEELYNSVKQDLSDYAEAHSEWARAESEHYSAVEDPDNMFYDQYEEKARLASEVDTIRTHLSELEDRQREEATLPAGNLRIGARAEEDPLLAPVQPKVTGKPKFSTYQRIGGGSGYRELLNVWSNKPGDSYTRGHYDHYANTVGHVRAEDHSVLDMPGVTGDRVEISADEPQKTRDVKSKIVEVRKSRDKLLTEMRALVREYDALPESEQTGDRAHQLAHKYAELNQRAVDFGKEEDRQLGLLRLALQDAGAADPSAAKKVAVLVESQSDWSQDASKHGIKKPVDAARVAELKADRTKAQEAVTQVAAKAEAARDDRLIAATDFHHAAMTPEMSREYETAMRDHRDNGVDSPPVEDVNDVIGTPNLVRRLLQDDYAVERDWFLRHPATRELLENYLDAHHAVEEVEVHEARAYQRLEAIEESIRDEQTSSGGVPDSPFIDTQVVHTLNAARFLVDAAERGHTDIAVSDAANRVKNAHLPIPAAELTYNQIVPGAITRLLGSLGFKDAKPDKLFIRGEGHWHWELTPEMRKAIRRYGLPILGVMALTPRDAEAQGSGAPSIDLYTSAIGGLAAGAALMYLASHRSARRLVHENRELARALMVDDLSGLANKRAFERAKAGVDADETYGWVVADGDRFKALNDAHGHGTGDKAIQHFGDVMRKAATDLDIPLRAFRVGGDEFAFAVPKDRQADLARYLEQHSPFTKGDVTTKLSAEMGDSFDEADAALIATKEARRQADPSLRRGGIVAVEKFIRDYTTSPDAPKGRGISADLNARLRERFGMSEREAKHAIDEWTGGPLRDENVVNDLVGDETNYLGDFHANPIGPAMRMIRRYPSAAGIAALGVALGESDDPDLKATSPYMLGLAALSAVGSAGLLKAKNTIVDATVKMMRDIGGENVVRQFNPDALLHPEVREAIDQYERDRARAKARATEFSAQSKALGPEGDRAVSDVLENEQWEDTGHFTPEQLTKVLSVASAIDAEYQATAQAQLASGARSPHELLPQYGGPRRYAAYEAEAVQSDNPGYVPPKATRIGGVKHRTLDEPIRRAEAALQAATATGDAKAIADAQDALDEAHVVQMSQRTQLGEIREQSYRAAQGIEAGHANAAAANLFTAIRQVPGSVHPEWEAAANELATAKQMRASATSQADRDAAQQLIDKATVTLDEITRRFKRADQPYVALPDSKGLGVLRGAVVKRDIAHSLIGFNDNTTYKRLLRAWKEIKTVFNPGTHLANVVSNFTFAHMEGLLLPEQPKYLKRALADMKSYGDATRTLAENGILDHNAVTADGAGTVGQSMRSREGLDELRETTRPETRSVLEDRGLTAAAQRKRESIRRVKGAAVGAAIGGAALADDENPEDAALGAAVGAGAGALAAGRSRSIKQLYNNEDNIFRVAIYLKKIDDGMTPDDAMRYSQSALGNFRSRSPVMNAVRTTLSPFILYPAKALPRFGRQVIDHPWRYAALIATWAAMNEYAEQQVGEVPDSDLGVKDRTQSKWGYFFPGFTQLPFANERGERAATDMGRWTPMSAITTGAPPGSVVGALSEDLPAVLQPGGPLIDAAAKLGGNVDAATGRPRYQRDYPAGENIAKLLNDASDLALPPALSFHRARLQEDVANRDFDKAKNDALGPTGLRPRFVRPGQNLRSAKQQLQTSLSSRKYDFETDMLNNKNQHPERVRGLVDRYLRRRKSAIDNYIKRTGSPPPADLVPPDGELPE